MGRIFGRLDVELGAGRFEQAGAMRARQRVVEQRSYSFFIYRASPPARVATARPCWQMRAVLLSAPGLRDLAIGITVLAHHEARGFAVGRDLEGDRLAGGAPGARDKIRWTCRSAISGEAAAWGENNTDRGESPRPARRCGTRSADRRTAFGSGRADAATRAGWNRRRRNRPAQLLLARHQGLQGLEGDRLLREVVGRIGQHDHPTR